MNSNDEPRPPRPPAPVVEPEDPLRPPLSAGDAHLVRTASWKTLLEDLDGDDLTSRKVRAFAAYVRRERVGVENALKTVLALRDTDGLLGHELLYVELLAAELSIAAGHPPERWSPMLAGARHLAGHYDLIAARDDYDAFLEAVHELEVGNTQMSVGPLLERLGFWTDVHLRAFFHLPATWCSDPNMGFGAGTVASRSGLEFRHELEQVLRGLEQKAPLIEADPEGAKVPFTPAELKWVRQAITDFGGDDGALDHLLETFAARIVRPSDLLELRDELRRTLEGRTTP